MKGFTRARPRISGWCSANQQASVPPTDKATMATSWQAAAIFVYADSASCDQSDQRVGIMSSTAVPWPGRRGRSTV
jgi:hypothetical protein